MFVRNAAKTYELAPAINKAESFCQVMKDVSGSVVLDICQSLHPSKVQIKHFQVFPNRSFSTRAGGKSSLIEDH